MDKSLIWRNTHRAAQLGWGTFSLLIVMMVRGIGERDGWRISPPGASRSLASGYTVQTCRKTCRNVFLKSLDRP